MFTKDAHMTKNNENEDTVFLDEKLIEKFARKIEKAINSILDTNEYESYSLELLLVLLSFSSQISIDIQMDEEDFTHFIKETYKKVIDEMGEDIKNKNIEELDISQLN